MQITDSLSLPQSASRKKREYFFYGYTDDSGNFRFESAYYKSEDLKYGRTTNHFITLNSFYRRPRNLKTLHTLHGLLIDLDGWDSPYPLRHRDILSRFRELGFLKPLTQINLTSPGRFHVILALRPLRAFPDKVSYLKLCAQGLCKAFSDFGADPHSSTNPVGFVRIPGSINFKYPHKPIVETVFASESVFSLTEIYQALQENKIIKKPKQKVESKANSVKEKINQILEWGVPIGKRDFACLTLAIHHNKILNYSQEQTLTVLLDWNERVLPQPLEIWEVEKKVGSAYRNDYGLSGRWLNWITQDSKEEIQGSYERAKAHKKEPLRTSLAKHAEKIKQFILDSGGIVEESQRRFAERLGMPFESLRKTFQLLANELIITAKGSGRNAKVTISMREDKRILRIVP